MPNHSDMARETIIRLTDDLDGSEASETIQFAFDGRSYEIDLSDKNAAAFRKALEKYVEKARRATSSISGPRRSTRRSTGDYDAEEGRAARQWAIEQGLNVPGRGRTPATIIDQWRQATR
jgi:hypothetical protein